MTLKQIGVVAGVVAALLTAPRPEAAQESVVARAQTLYAAARYEDALAVLEHADTSTRSRAAFDVLRYRALCWLALGQDREAERAIAAVVDLNPLYAPAPTDVAPRIAQAFARIRQDRLPGLARSSLVDAHRALKRRDAIEADKQLLLATRILGDPVFATRPELGDLRLAADALSDLRRLQRLSEPWISEPEGVLDRSATDGVRTARPEPLGVDADSPPVPMDQVMPAWEPNVSSLARTQMEGAVRVYVDWRGQVVSATVERPTYPAYDRQVLAATRAWRYRPAQRAGVPVGAEIVVPYILRPPAEWQIFRGAGAQ